MAGQTCYSLAGIKGAGDCKFMDQSDARHAERFAQYWKRTCIDAGKMNIDIKKKRCYTLDSANVPQFDKHFFHVPYNSLKQGKIPEEILLPFSSP